MRIVARSRISGCNRTKVSSAKRNRRLLFEQFEDRRVLATPNDDWYTVTIDTPLVVNAAQGLLSNDEYDGGVLIDLHLATAPNSGTIPDFQSDGSFTYVPNEGFYGWDSFFYGLCDGECNAAWVWIKVNYPPMATDDTLLVAQDTPLLLTPGILDNDTDQNNDPLAPIIVTQPSNGTLEALGNGHLIYTPDPHSTGPDTFTYRVSDANALSNIATVNFNVLPIDPSLVAIDDYYPAPAGQAVVDYAAGVLGNDGVPAGITPTVLLVSQPAHGTLIFYDDGTFYYQPNNAAFSTDTFTYRFRSTQGVSNLATVTIQNEEATEIALTRFYGDGENLKVQYAVLDGISGPVGPFTVGIYASPDGQTPQQLLQEFAVQSADRTQGLHTLQLTPTFPDLPGDYYLVAKIDNHNDIDDEANENNNVARLLPGSFLVSQTVGGQTKKILHVHGSDGNDNPVWVYKDDTTDHWMVWASQTAVPAPQTGPAYDFTGDGLVTWIDAAGYSNPGQAWWGWQNTSNRWDVDADGVVVPLDALILINDYNTYGEHLLTGPRAGNFRLDVTGDYVLSVLDIAQAIDKINGGPGDYNPPGRNATAPHSVSAQAINSFLGLGMTDYGDIVIDEVHIRAHAGDDIAMVHDTRTVFFGAGGIDIASGSDLGDLLDGGPGDDMLFGYGGDDHILGGDGHDWLTGEYDDKSYPWLHPGSDTLDGGAGDDVLHGNNLHDQLFGGLGNDTLLGGAGNDSLRGDDGDDNLDGGTDADQLFGGNGADTAWGNAGDDIIHGEAGNDTLQGGLGSDRLDGGDGDDQSSPGVPAWATDPDTHLGGSGNDTITGGLGPDAIAGGDGNDTLDGAAGDDTIDGNDGDDTLTGASGNDTLAGGSGADNLNGGEGNDGLYGGAETDSLNDTIGENVIDHNGNPPRDIVITGLTSDGTDLTITYSITGVVPPTFTIALYASPDGEALGQQLQIVTPPAGFNAAGPHSFPLPATFTDLPYDYYLVAVVDSDRVVAETSDANNQTRFDSGIFVAQDTGDSVVHIHGGDTADEASASVVDGLLRIGQAEYVFDYSLMSIKGVRFRGHGGNDGLTISVEWYHYLLSRLYGGDGDDSLTGGVGDDYFDGGAGNDTLLGQDGHDVIVGGDGADEIEGNNGDDILVGDEDDASIDGGDGDDDLYGGNGSNTSGGSGSNSYDGYPEGDVPEEITLTLDPPSDAVEGVGITITGHIWPPGNYLLTGTNSADYQSFPVETDSTGTFQISSIFSDDGPSPGNGTSQDDESIDVEVCLFGHPTLCDDDSVDLTVHNSPPALDVWLQDGQVHGIVGEYRGAIPDADIVTVTINWGDGTNPEIITGLLTEQPNEEYFFEEWFESLAHTYANPNQTYTIAVTAQDDDGGETTKYVSSQAEPVLLTIFNGQNGRQVPHPQNLSVGAFTVANLNDTDGDAVEDNWDDIVDIITPELAGKAEVDLMKLVIHRPENYDGMSPVVVTTSTNSIKFWTEPTKVECLNPEFLHMSVWFAAGESERTVWVEMTAPSSQVRLDRITATYMGIEDSAAVTGIWTQIIDYELTTRPARTMIENGVQIQGVLDEEPWSRLQRVVGRIVQIYGGTGPRPLTLENGLANVIVQAWEPVPVGILEEPTVKFVIARRADVMSRVRRENGTISDLVRDIYPSDPDFANDTGDSASDNEQAGDLLFVVDTPGLPRPPVSGTFIRIALRFNMEEFVRVNVNGSVPDGDGNIASRGSDYFPWFSHSYITRPTTVDSWTTPSTYNVMGTGNDWTFPDM